MIFSKQSVETAYEYLGRYYNKILLIDLNRDLYFPIKVDDIEYKEIPSGITFTQWVKGFVESDKFYPFGKDRSLDEFKQYYDINYLKSLNVPLTLKYGKSVHGEVHAVELVFLPIGEGRAYLYVRDLSKMAQAIL